MTFMHIDAMPAAAAIGGETGIVTVGFTIFTQVAGYAEGSYGNIDPNPFIVNSFTYQIFNSSSEPSFEWDFQVGVVGSVPQSTFTSVTVRDGTGATRTYNSADADAFGFTHPWTTWKWGNGTDVVWTQEDGGLNSPDPPNPGEEHPVTVFV